MPVRVILPDGETVFTYATSAVVDRGILGVFAWNPETKTPDEIATFRLTPS